MDSLADSLAKNFDGAVYFGVEAERCKSNHAANVGVSVTGRGLIMVTRNKKRAGEKKRRVKVGKLEKVKELSAADKKKVRGGDTKPANTAKPTKKTEYLVVTMNDIIIT